jgi:hypothetical protein
MKWKLSINEIMRCQMCAKDSYEIERSCPLQDGDREVSDCVSDSVSNLLALLKNQLALPKKTQNSVSNLRSLPKKNRFGKLQDNLHIPVVLVGDAAFRYYCRNS